MLTFTDDERTSPGRMRGITQDPQGRAVLVGLTFEETDFYIAFRRKFLIPERHRGREHQRRYLELHRKHEIARLERVGTEIHLRNENPIRNKAGSAWAGFSTRSAIELFLRDSRQQELLSLNRNATACVLVSCEQAVSRP